jgi:hypothetical protein
MAKRVSRSKSSDDSPAASPKRPARAPRAKASAGAPTAPVSADDAPNAMATEMAPSEPVVTGLPPSSEAASNGAMAMSSEPAEEDIRLRAYHKFLHRKGGAGSDWDDWFAAEKELGRRPRSEKRQLS